MQVLRELLPFKSLIDEGSFLLSVYLSDFKLHLAEIWYNGVKFY